MAEIVPTVPFNYDELYANIKSLFVEKGYIDANYEGSNTAQLITAMTYLTSMLNVNTAVNVNETILTLAQKRNNILEDARVLGYEISHIKSYSYYVTLTFTAGNHSIPKYTKFNSGSKNYYFMGETKDLIGVADGHQETILIREGDLKLYTDYPFLTTIVSTQLDDFGVEIAQYYIDVPFQNIEENGIEVFLTYYDEFGILHSKEPWTKSTQFMVDKDSFFNKQYIRLDDIEFQAPRIYFKLAGVGTNLRVDTEINLNVLVSSGVDGAITTPLTTDIPCTVSSYTINEQGTNEESLDSIRENAPLFHNSANRAVTKSDYISICTRQTAIEEAEVWGGDDEYPKVPGHVWFSFRPSTLTRAFTPDAFKFVFTMDNAEDLVNWYLEESDITNVNKTGVWDILDNYKIPTLVYHNRHPIYLDFTYNINILRYNITTSKAAIHQAVFDVIDNYFTGTFEPLPFEQFGVEYFHSSIEKRIDLNLTDITGFNNTLTTQFMVTSKNLIQENTNLNNYDIIIPLAIPFESYFNGDNLNYLNLPKIDTTTFAGQDIFTDFSTMIGNEKNQAILQYDIRASTGEIVGSYTIFNLYRFDIIVKFFVKDTGADGVYATSLFNKSDFDTPQYLNLEYASPNFTISKNCIPRLKQVNFQ